MPVASNQIPNEIQTIRQWLYIYHYKIILRSWFNGLNSLNPHNINSICMYVYIRRDSQLSPLTDQEPRATDIIRINGDKQNKSKMLYEDDVICSLVRSSSGPLLHHPGQAEAHQVRN